jgi:ketosteroid isomerase-like protein
MRLAAFPAIGLLATATPALACDGDTAGVRAVAEGIVAADNARDIGRVLAYYADDAVLLPPGELPLSDHGEIRRRYDGLFQDFDPDIEARIDEICADGNIAFVRGHNGGWLVSRVGGRSRELDDVYLMVLRRDAGGDWKIARLMWHPAHAPSP